VIAQGDSTVRVSPPTSLVTPECLLRRFTSKPRCMAVHAAMNERRDHHLAPAADNDTESVLDEAINSLARLRAMGGRGNAGVDLHLLTSLIDEAQTAERCRCSSTRPGLLVGGDRRSSRSHPGECVAALRRRANGRPEAGRGQAVNGGVGQFPLSEIEPDQRAISTRSTRASVPANYRSSTAKEVS